MWASKAASGDWIVLLDADDHWHPDKTARQLEALRTNPELKLIGSRVLGEMPVGPLAEAPVRPLHVRDFLISTPLGPSSALIHRDALEAVGLFDEQLTSVEDRDLWLRIAARFDTAEVQSPCWSYRVHSNQMNRNAERMYQNYDAVLQKFLTNHSRHHDLANEAYAFLYLDSTLSLLDQGDRTRALRFLLQSFGRWPQPLGDSQLPTRHRRVKLLIRIILGESVFGRMNQQRKTWSDSAAQD